MPIYHEYDNELLRGETVTMTEEQFCALDLVPFGDESNPRWYYPNTGLSSGFNHLYFNYSFKVENTESGCKKVSSYKLIEIDHWMIEQKSCLNDDKFDALLVDPETGNSMHPLYRFLNVDVICKTTSIYKMRYTGEIRQTRDYVVIMRVIIENDI